MSEFRKISIEVSDIEALEQAYKELGYTVHRNRRLTGYGNFVDKAGECDLAVDTGTYNWIGYKRNDKGGLDLVHDSTDKSSALRLHNRAEALYKKNLILNKAHMIGFGVSIEQETNDKIIMRLRRG